MARGFMNSSATGRACACPEKDMSNWTIINKSQIQTGKNFGKVKATIYCNKCKHQWETTAKYIEKLIKMN